MRIRTLLVLAFVALVIAGATAALVFERTEPELLKPEASVIVTAPIAPEVSVANIAAAPEPSPDPAPPPPVPADAPSDSLSELPVQEVEPFAVHTVPDSGSGPVPHVVILDRDGRPLARLSTSAPPPPSYVPSVGPAPNYAAPTSPPASYRPSVGPAPDSVAPNPPPASYRPSVPPSGAATQPVQQAGLPRAQGSLSGPAHATGTVSLAVDGHTVRLFGVLPPASTDRCAIGRGAPQNCAEVTQAMLAARLAHSASVNCRQPPGSGGADSARICLDAAGIDIAGYLVGEGLAVADQHAGNGYAGAESIARSNGKGLWRYR